MRKPCQVLPGARSIRRVRPHVRESARQAPYSANDSMAFQSAGRSRASTDWVMVCSSTLRAMAVIHSAKRRRPRRVKAQAKEPRRACQTDQSNGGCDMARLRYGAKWGLPPGRFRPGDVALNTIYLYRLCGEIRGNYWLPPLHQIPPRLSREVHVPIGSSSL